jgi:prepilin-type N-terminal cleavage/methylation domain-containing protein
LWKAANLSWVYSQERRKRMRNRGNTIWGFTLTEMLVAMAIMTILMAVAIPAAKKLSESMEQSTGVKTLIDAALSNARAVAVREQKYAGVRFQMDATGKQHLIFIIHDPDNSPNGTGIANGFRVVDGRKPMALPEDTGVIASANYNDAYLQTPAGMNDATTFSILFGPSGQFVVHQVRVYSSDGLNSTDRVFNNKSNVDAKFAKFRRDDSVDGFQQEDSVSKIVIYDKKQLGKFALSPWSQYLSGLNSEHISPYTGELIKKN